MFMADIFTPPYWKDNTDHERHLDQHLRSVSRRRNRVHRGLGKTRDYLKTFPAHIETALHQSLQDARFRFVNIAHWTSENEFNAAVGSRGFQEAASDLRWPMNPALYQVVSTG